MLLELDVENLAVIAFAQISFESGMTVMTGETGAGKSILIACDASDHGRTGE